MSLKEQFTKDETSKGYGTLKGFIKFIAIIFAIFLFFTFDYAFKQGAVMLIVVCVVVFAFIWKDSN